jgi:hypothetical protein
VAADSRGAMHRSIRSTDLALASAPPAAGARRAARVGGPSPSWVALAESVEALAAENARLRAELELTQAELAVWRSLEQVAAERVYAALVGGDFELDQEPGVNAFMAKLVADSPRAPYRRGDG